MRKKRRSAFDFALCFVFSCLLFVYVLHVCVNLLFMKEPLECARALCETIALGERWGCFWAEAEKIKKTSRRVRVGLSLEEFPACP